MADADLGALLVRMVLSLFVVLAIVLGAYAVLRRRSVHGLGAARMARGRTRSPRSTGRTGLRVLARAGLGRNTAVAAVQFADRVVLVGSSEHAAPTLLGELTLDDWIELTAPAEEATPLPTAIIDAAAGPSGSPGGGSAGTPTGLLDALREATTRRA